MLDLDSSHLAPQLNGYSHASCRLENSSHSVYHLEVTGCPAWQLGGSSCPALCPEDLSYQAHQLKTRAKQFTCQLTPVARFAGQWIWIILPRGHKDQIIWHVILRILVSWPDIHQTLLAQLVIQTNSGAMEVIWPWLIF